MKLGVHVNLGPGDIVLDGGPASPEKGAQHIHFSADVYCSQTAGWIKMPLDTKVGIGPGHIALGVDPAHPLPRKKGAQPLNFRPMSIVAKRSPISATAEHLCG